MGGMSDIACSDMLELVIGSASAGVGGGGDHVGCTDSRGVLGFCKELSKEGGCTGAPQGLSNGERLGSGV